MTIVSSIETAYSVMLVLALTFNGIAVAGGVPLRRLLAPIREVRTIAGVFTLDLVLVPAVIFGMALLLDVDPVTRAGLVIVGAASCGPIGIALTRIARGDLALSVTLVLGLGALNLVTVPLVTGVLLPSGIRMPVPALLASLLSLAVAPLLLGRLVGRVLDRRAMSGPERKRTMLRFRRAADVCLLGAVTVALLLEPRAVMDVLAGPVLGVAIVTMLVVTFAARLLTRDPARVRTIAVTINARAIGLALTLTTLHLGGVEGLRAVVLTYGGLTQVIPVLTVLALRRRSDRRVAS